MIKKIVADFSKATVVFFSLCMVSSTVEASQTVLAKNWMSGISDESKLENLSIPGTHDTMTYQGNWGIGIIQSFTQTQTLSLEEQLNSGTRFLDLRVGKDMVMHHGFVTLKSKFDKDVMAVVKQFLKDNPSETLIFRVKDENNPEKEEFDKQIGKIITEYQELFVKNDKQSLYLGEIRGKIVVLDNTSTYSFSERNASPIRWNSSTKMMIQDNYNNPTYEDKLTDIIELLGEVNQLNQDYLYANHVSATGEIPFGRTPKSYAKFLNPKILDAIQMPTVERTGIMIFDFVTPDINRIIFEKNMMTN